MSNIFHVARPESGYRVELHRGGKPYVTFVDGLTKEAAEQEARSLEILWQKLKIRRAVPSSHTTAAHSDMGCPTIVRRFRGWPLFPSNRLPGTITGSPVHPL